MSKLKSLNIDVLKWMMLLSLFIISLIFRFGIPTEPADKLIFDENYFVPQTESYMVNRFFNDPHGIVGRIPLFVGHILGNPDYQEKLIPANLSDKSDEKYTVTLDLGGIRAFPKLIGSLLPVLGFILIFQIVNWRKPFPTNIAGYLIPYAGGLLLAFENSLILDSRIAMLSQPMFILMLLTLVCTISYFQSRAKKKSIALFGLLVVTIGLTMGTKLIAWSVIPFALSFVWWKEFVSMQKFRFIKRALGATVIAAIVIYLAFIVYLGTFLWHFNQIKHYSPAAHEVTESYKQDLMDGTNNTTFLAKYWDWQQRSLRYQSLVPELDYAKDDEIGSMWITWPIMARPINYWNEYAENQTIFQGLITIGNPTVWFLGLIGVLVLSGIGVSRLFAKNAFNRRHLFVLALYFANWLPFATISRVMYIYHYYPALIFSVIVWAVLLHDFIIPRIVELVGKISSKQTFVQEFKKNRVEWVTVTIFIAILFFTVLGFYLYAPFTYKLPIGKADFENRMLLKEWNVKWKGAK